MTTMVFGQEGLDPSTWLERMDRLAESIAQGAAAPDRHIRQAYHLQCLAPDGLRPMMTTPIEEERLEAMLEGGAFEAAVASVVGTASPERNSEASDHYVLRREDESLSSKQKSGVEADPMEMLQTWAKSFLRLRPQPH